MDSPVCSKKARDRMPDNESKIGLNMDRRDFLKLVPAAAVAGAVGCSSSSEENSPSGENTGSTSEKAAVAIIKASNYKDSLKQKILDGFTTLGIESKRVKGKRVLLKPNLVEPHSEAEHINTNPLVIQAAAAAFLHLGAENVVVAEGAGHVRDSYLVLEESGLADIVFGDRIPFIDLNFAPSVSISNRGRWTGMGKLIVPEEIFKADIVVSLAKMKTHHWVGATLSMKNMFGIMPGSYYGWPKNILHLVGIPHSILDIVATAPPDIAIVDGITGMEGDGPIMGTPVSAGVIVMGTNPVSVDATCCRVMGIDPGKVCYISMSEGRLGHFREEMIDQRGESIGNVMKKFQLLDFIPSHRKILGID